jgi:hypothetical protein
MYMLHVFYSNVVYGCNGFQVYFRCVFQVFHKHVSSVSTAFRRMLQPLYLDVSKVDQVLHLFSSHLLLHRLSRSWQGIHTNKGWAMLPLERDGRWAEGCIRRGWEQGAQVRGDVGTASTL